MAAHLSDLCLAVGWRELVRSPSIIVFVFGMSAVYYGWLKIIDMEEFVPKSDRPTPPHIALYDFLTGKPSTTGDQPKKSK